MDSLIGRDVEVKPSPDRPKATRLMVGDHCIIEPDRPGQVAEGGGCRRQRPLRRTSTTLRRTAGSRPTRRSPSLGAARRARRLGQQGGAGPASTSGTIASAVVGLDRHRRLEPGPAQRLLDQLTGRGPRRGHDQRLGRHPPQREAAPPDVGPRRQHRQQLLVEQRIDGQARIADRALVEPELARRSAPAPRPPLGPRARRCAR